jgi:hypothetical protein
MRYRGGGIDILQNCDVLGGTGPSIPILQIGTPSKT